MLNRVELIGKLRGKSDITYVGQKGTAKCDVSIQIENYDVETKSIKRENVSCVAWGKTAENIQNNANEGDLLFIEGKVVTNESRKQDGSLMAFTNVSIQKWKNLSIVTRKSAQTSEYQPNNDDYGPQLDITTEDLPFNHIY